MDEPARRLYDWLLKRSAGSDARRVRAAGLFEAAVEALGLDVVEARGIFRNLRRTGQVDFAPDTAGLPYTGYATVKPPSDSEPASAAAWRRALDTLRVDADLHQALLPAHELFADLDVQDMELIVAGLARVRMAVPATGRSRYGFSLSARELLGSSKILDRLPLPARRLLGVSELASTPRYVVVAGPPQPAAVMLIENTTSFEEAVRAGIDEDLALIAAYGYGLNLMTDSIAGWALVDSLNNAQCEVLSRRGRDHQLPELLRHEHLYFWGDLDREGLRIALALRTKLPQLELSALYTPMCSMVQEPANSHPYALACGKLNQQPWRDVGDALLDGLAGLCRKRAVDQECLDVGLHRPLSLQALLTLNQCGTRPICTT